MTRDCPSRTTRACGAASVEGVEGAPGAQFGHGLDRRDSGDDREDGNRVAQLAEDQREDADGDQQQLQRLEQRLAELADERLALPMTELVRAMPRQPAGGLLAA